MLLEPMQRGRALHVVGTTHTEEKVEITHCDFRSNNALMRSPSGYSEEGFGGAVNMELVAGAKIRLSTFTDNRAVRFQLCVLHRPSGDMIFHLIAVKSWWHISSHLYDGSSLMREVRIRK